MANFYDLSQLSDAREHENARKYFGEELAKFDHPEALRALRGVCSLLRMVSGSLWDGSNGLDPGRATQARIDATVMADLGTAIEDHCKGHGN